jgi:hypothetical protein
MTTATKKFYIIYWHQSRHIGHLDGCDLVFATSKREARAIYKLNHFSPIDEVIAEGEGHDWVFSGITNDEGDKARVDGIVNLETGS